MASSCVEKCQIDFSKGVEFLDKELLKEFLRKRKGGYSGSNCESALKKWSRKMDLDSH